MTDANVVFPYEDPLSHVRKKDEQPVGWDLVDSPASHYVTRSFGLNQLKKHMHSGVGFDKRWSCPKCRPSLERRAVRRILEAFSGLSIWVELTPVGHRRRAHDAARRADVRYVSVPIGSQVVLLATGPISEHGTLLLWSDRKEVVEMVLRLKKVGSIGATRGFLAPARDYDFWEAYHPATKRRCWHLHSPRSSARECAEETGQELDGTSKGWYVRGTTENYALGTLRDRDGVVLRALLDRLEIPHWHQHDEQHPEANDQQGSSDKPPRDDLGISAMEWDDPRLVRFRQEAGWRPPARSGDNWQPPPFQVSLSITYDGRLQATVENRKGTR